MATMPIGRSTAGAKTTTTQPVAAKQQQRWSFDLTLARIMAALSALMLPGGVVAIILGWYGAAHTPFVFEQMPYLISGGLLGVGLIVGGGLLYLGSWLARLAEQERDEGEKIRELIKGLQRELEYLPAAVAGVPATVHGVFVATKTGTMFHTRDCNVVAGREDLREVSADDGLSPCKLCNPLD